MGWNANIYINKFFSPIFHCRRQQLIPRGPGQEGSVTPLFVCALAGHVIAGFRPYRLRAGKRTVCGRRCPALPGHPEADAAKGKIRSSLRMRCTTHRVASKRDVTTGEGPTGMHEVHHGVSTSTGYTPVTCHFYSRDVNGDAQR